MPENREAFELWNRCQTQWIIGGMGIPIGVNYMALFKVAEVCGIDITPGLLDKIQALEMAHITKPKKGGKSE